MSVWISNCFKKYVSCFGIDPNAPITMGITLTVASEYLHILDISAFSLAYFVNFSTFLSVIFLFLLFLLLLSLSSLLSLFY